VLLVPADAVRDNAVYLIDGNRVRRREVKIGIRGTRAVEILSGLADGERIASPTSTDLQDGARVGILETPASGS
jgi:membrane fusion protein (multidrug efflux system)